MGRGGVLLAASWTKGQLGTADGMLVIEESRVGTVCL